MSNPSYTITTEDRGHGIIAIYTTGPASEILAIEAASHRYARKTLGATTGPVSSGGEIKDKGETYTAQQVYCTHPLAPRTDGGA